MPDSSLVDGGTLTEPGRAMADMWKMPVKEEYVAEATGCPVS